MGCRLRETGTSPAEPLVSSHYLVFSLSLIFVCCAVSSNPRNVTSVFGSSPEESCPVYKWDQVCQLHLLPSSLSQGASVALRVGKKNCILLAAMWAVLRLGWALVSQSLQILTAPLKNSTSQKRIFKSLNTMRLLFAEPVC